MTKIIFALLFLAILGTAAFVYFTTFAPGTVVLTGTVRYSERVALPPGSVLTVELRSVPVGDVPPAIISQYQYTTNGENVPLPYTLTYNSGDLERNTEYGLFAQLHVDGELRFITTSSYPIAVGRDEASGIDVLLTATSTSATTTEDESPVPGGTFDGKKAPSPSPLAGTSWIWKETVHGDSVITPGGDEFVLTFTETGVRSTTDCNSMSGSYVFADSNITFSPFAMTEMYCEGSLEAPYANDLAKAISFTLEGSALTIVVGAESEMRFVRTQSVSDVEGVADPDMPVSSETEAALELDVTTNTSQ